MGFIRLIGLCVAALVATCARAQWQSLNGGVTSEVRSFAQPADSSRLLAGGKFPFVHQDDLRVNNIAWWDGAHWAIDGLANGNGDTSTWGDDTPVFSLAIRPDTIFASHLSDRWHYDTAMGYATLLTDEQWQPCAMPDGIFYFLEANGRMFSGGVHDELYGAYAPGIHEWRNGAFENIPNMPFTSQVQVNDVAYWHGEYYFGGAFQAFECRKMVAYDGVDQWTPLEGGVGGNFVSTVCGFGDSLYVGGFFTGGSDVYSTHLQLWDGTSWQPFFPQVEYVGVVRDIQVYDGALYISGIYHWQGDNTWYGLLRYDGHQLCTIGGPMPSGDNSVMSFFQDDLYLGLGATFPGLEYEFIGRLPLEGLIPDTCVTVSPTGMAEAPGMGQGVLSIFPNPTTDVVWVQLPQGLDHGQLLVHDSSGRLVLSRSFANTSRPDVRSGTLAQGSYTLTLVHDGVRKGIARFTKL